MDEHRELLAKANQQIELNNQEMNRLKEASLSKNNLSMTSEDSTVGANLEDEYDERQMREIVEQFEVNLQKLDNFF